MAAGAAASGNVMYKRMCDALGAEDIFADERFAEGPGRSEHRDALHTAISAYTRTCTTEEWVATLNKAGVPSGPVHSIDQTFNDPQVKHLGMAAKVDHPSRGEIELVGQPVRFHRTPWQLRSATPEMGEHTETILAELGYSEANIAAMGESGVY